MIEKLEHYAIKCGNAQKDYTTIPKAWEGRYDELAVNSSHLIRNDVTGLYTPQGATTDGEYIYRALVWEDAAPTLLQKISIETGEIVFQRADTSFGHANDMTYRHGKLYIAHSSSTSTVYEVDAESFELLATRELPLTIWGIAYEPVNDLFVFGGVGSAYFSVYYASDFSFMYRIKPQNAFTGTVRQGIHADANYIYVALDNAYGAVTGNESGSRIMVYTWNGMFIKSLHVSIKEIEWAFPLDGQMYLGTYEGRDADDIKRGRIYKIPYDLYPEQTAQTGRPTDVSGGVNNLQRLPEATPVRLWTGDQSSGTITFKTYNTTNLKITEAAPFRYFRIRFKGANQGVFDWYPAENGVAAIREVDITAAASDSNFRVREARLTAKFTGGQMTGFTIDSNFCDEFMWDASEGKLAVTKYTDEKEIELIHITQIWGVI